MISYWSQIVLKILKQGCNQQKITSKKTSNHSHPYWKETFSRKLNICRTYAASETDNKKDNSTKGNKTTNIYKQNLLLNGYYIIPELNDVSQSGYYTSPFRI